LLLSQLGAKFARKFRTKIGWKSRVFDVSVKRERDGKVPEPLIRLDNAAPHIDIRSGSAVGALHNALD